MLRFGLGPTVHRSLTYIEALKSTALQSSFIMAGSATKRRSSDLREGNESSDYDYEDARVGFSVFAGLGVVNMLHKDGSLRCMMRNVEN